MIKKFKVPQDYHLSQSYTTEYRWGLTNLIEYGGQAKILKNEVS